MSPLEQKLNKEIHDFFISRAIILLETTDSRIRENKAKVFQSQYNQKKLERDKLLKND